MAILRRQLWDVTTGSLGEQQEWWDLCYDDERRAFFVEHLWHHINKVSLLEPPSLGREHIIVASYNGPCWWLIDDLEDELLAEAGHD